MKQLEKWYKDIRYLFIHEPEYGSLYGLVVFLMLLSVLGAIVEGIGVLPPLIGMIIVWGWLTVRLIRMGGYKRKLKEIDG